MDFKWSDGTSLTAIIISIIALTVNFRFSRRNMRLAIQQAIFKIVTEKAKDCNTVWDNEPKNSENPDNWPHFLVMTELVITTEIIDRSFSLFDKNLKGIKELEDDYYYLFYKQLKPDVRGWIQRTPEIAKKENSKIYTGQVTRVYEKLKKHFE